MHEANPVTPDEPEPVPQTSLQRGLPMLTEVIQIQYFQWSQKVMYEMLQAKYLLHKIHFHKSTYHQEEKRGRQLETQEQVQAA